MLFRFYLHSYGSQPTLCYSIKLVYGTYIIQYTVYTVPAHNMLLSQITMWNHTQILYNQMLLVMFVDKKWNKIFYKNFWTNRTNFISQARLLSVVYACELNSQYKLIEMVEEMYASHKYPNTTQTSNWKKCSNVI